MTALSPAPEGGVGEMEGKVALITGAGPGVGRACAAAFARAGAEVVIAARNETRLTALARELQADNPGSVIRPMTVDLADISSCAALVEQVTATCGGVDAVVNVATAGSGGAIDTDDFETWRHAFEVNVLGTLEVSRCAARSMVERGGGSIVQIGTFGTLSLPKRLAAYTSTKLAMSAASLTLAKELGPRNVRVNVVVPGYITGQGLDMIVHGVSGRTQEGPTVVSERLASTAALRRHVDPEDIAEATLFLSSARARMITGVELPVTAGQ